MSSRATISSMLQTWSAIPAATAGDVLRAWWTRAKLMYMKWRATAAMWFSNFLLNAPAEAYNGRMVKWHYSILIYPVEDLESSHGVLEEWGEEGSELVGFHPLGPTSSKYIFIFKQPKQA